MKEASSQQPSVSAVLRFGPIHFFMWALFSCFLSFLVHYLQSSGYSGTLTGAAMTALTVAGILGQFLGGWLCDRLGTRKRIFIPGAALATGLTLLLLGRPPAAALLLLMAGIGFFHKPLPAILDSWIFSALDRETPGNRNRYGTIRSLGSLGFALFSIVLGLLIDTLGWPAFFAAAAILGLITSLAALGPRDEKPQRHPEQASPAQLFRLPGYGFYVLVSVLMIFPMFLMVFYLAAILENAGGSASLIGLALFLNAASEIPVISASGRLLIRFRPRQLLLAAAGVFALRLGFLCLTGSALAVTLSFVFQSISFGLFLPSLRHVLYELAPPHLKTSAFSTAEAFYGGLGGVLASLTGGILLDVHGVQAMLAVGFVSAAASFLLLLFHRNLGLDKEKSIP